MDYKNKEYWQVMLIGILEAITLTLSIWIISAITSCSCKHIERVNVTHDTLIKVQIDTLWRIDTLKISDTLTQHDSTFVERKTLQIVDTAGRVIKEYIYQDRLIYKDKSSNSDNRQTSAVKSTTTSSTKETMNALQSEKETKQTNAYKYIVTIASIAVLVFAFLWIIRGRKD